MLESTGKPEEQSNSKNRQGSHIFIRYNQVIKFWEYDTSGGSGTGPWLVLPVDIALLEGTLPPVPPAANVVLTDKDNIFTNEKQTITGTNTPGLRIVETDQPTNRQKWRLASFNGDFFLQALNDAETTETDKGYIFRRDGVVELNGIKIGTGTTLNHFSENSWIPALTSTTPASGVGYARQAGRYTKIGRQILCYFNTVISNVGSGGSGPLSINLPFPGDAGIYQSFTLGFFGGINGSAITISLVIAPNSSFATFYFKNASSPTMQDGTMTWANILVNTEFMVSFTYVTNQETQWLILPHSKWP